MGVLCDGKFHHQFQKSANSPNFILILKHLREVYGKMFVILDNARAHKSKAIQECPASTNGDVVLRHLPPHTPHTPQHNPIEIQWREIKHPLSSRFYKGGLDEMKKVM